MRNKKAQGFTLIELLIVIAIIGILSAVLIPNLLNARRNATNTAAEAYAKNVVTYIAAADTTTPGISTINSCTAQALQDEGAPNALPSSVSACAVAFDSATTRYSVSVTATSGGTYGFTY